MERYNLVLTQEEIELIAKLIDLGVRAQGLAVVKQAAHVISKLESVEPIKEEEEENGS